jgi:hypothetical protein
VSVEYETRSDQGWIFPIFLLPSSVTHDHNWISPRAIVALGEDPSGIGANAEHAEVVSGNVLREERLSGLVASRASSSDQAAPGLESCEFPEPGGVVAEGFVFVIGEQGPIILHATIHAAVLYVTNPIELAGLGHGQRSQQDSMHEREDGGRRADSQCQR